MRWIPFACILALGCGGEPPAVAPPEPPIVTVEKAVLRQIEDYTEFTGYLKSPMELQVRSQVTGRLKSIAFKDGDKIKVGDVLFEIDAAPFQAAKLSAQANIESAKETIRKAEADINTAKTRVTFATADRERKLKKENNSFLFSEEDREKSQRDFDAAKAEAASVEATLLVQKAALAKAESDFTTSVINLGYCTIRLEANDMTAEENKQWKTPPEQIVARVSRREVTQGTLVNAGQTVLCTVYSLNPIYAYFNVDDTTSLLYRRRIYEEKTIPKPEDKPLDCWIATKDEKGYPHAGVVNYISPEIVRSTASREIRGVFKNDDLRLSPGDSVRVKVAAGPPMQKITIPEIAIGMRQQQKYVYVVVNGSAEFRPVEIGPLRVVEGVRLAIIEKGLSVNDMVVVNGLLRVRPGAPVNAKEQSTTVVPK